MDIINVKQLNEDKSLAHGNKNIRSMMSDEILSLTHKIPAVLARTVIFTRVEVSDTRYTDCGKLAAVQQCGWSLTLPRVKCRTVAQRQKLVTATCP